MEKSNNNRMRALYVFSGKRRKVFQGVSSVDYPDTQFYGMNHLKDFGVDAEYKEFEDSSIGNFFAPYLGFRVKHSLMYFYARKYDVVFGISIIYMLIWKKIIPTKTKFVIFNSVFVRMLNVYSSTSWQFKVLVWILKDADGIVFLSQADMKKVADSIPSIADKLYFVHMGVDAQYLKPTYDERMNFFLSVGRDNARDYKTLVDVARKMPDEEFHFVCLPRNIEDIEDMPANIRIHINIPRENLDNLYRQAKALLLITHNDSYIDGSDSSGPTVLLEAMAVGLPIIASKKAYIGDYGSHNVDMCLVDFYDSDAIVRSIRIISDPVKRRSIAEHARLKVDTICNTQEMAHGLSDVFKKVCAK
jgi:glycosyltransferase involved in cell wall biosynthesis